ncbi:hypothetical protein ACFX13_021809 [Malus domestica]|uniref:DUF4408 domain-containing protein n=1 Tax=Malus domestica TaxID=3750 RepID=A0A498HLM9_MALDO|nr:myb-like protein X [Malus domestica]RXH71620.1 hypothetical protein DVH24_025121 [Malus domestica]
MDQIKAEKLRAMKCYKKKQNYNKSNQFLYSLIVHALIAVTCSLLCSYSYSFPSLHTIKHLLFISLPNSWSGFINPKCLFIVVNFIVVFLIGESRLSSGKQSSPVTEMYNEYVERSRNLRRPLSTFREKKEERTLPEMLNPINKGNAESIEDKEVDEGKQDDKHDHDHDEEDFKECGENDEEEKEEEKMEGKMEEKEEREEDEALMPAEELNKRVEDFIARVNKQRWLEARYLVCCKA